MNQETGRRSGAPPRLEDIVLAVDGGNSKTDLALVAPDGALLAFVRGPLGSPHHIGVSGCVALLQALLDHALSIARPDAREPQRPVARVAHIMLAGLDFADEERALHEAVAGLGWAARVVVTNDTFAVLRAGTTRGWGVAVTCGSGINCVGIGPDGRHVRFPSLGAITGDWGGGMDLGVAALGAAARSQDGRGPATTLQRAVPAHFGLSSPLAVAEAIHMGTIAERRLGELAPVVFAEADVDDVAARLVARLAGEVVAFVRAAVRRLELGRHEPEILLGGGLMQAADGRLVGATRAALSDIGLTLPIRAVAVPPIVGAVLLGLDDIGAGQAAQDRIAEELRRVVPSAIAFSPQLPVDQEPAGMSAAHGTGLAGG